MFSPKYRGRLLLGLCLQSSQQLSGINAVVFYSQTIFQGPSATPDSMFYA